MNGHEAEKAARGRPCRVSSYYCGHRIEDALEEKKTKDRENIHSVIHSTNIYQAPTGARPVAEVPVLAPREHPFWCGCEGESGTR